MRSFILPFLLFLCGGVAWAQSASSPKETPAGARPAHACCQKAGSGHSCCSKRAAASPSAMAEASVISSHCSGHSKAVTENSGERKERPERTSAAVKEEPKKE